MFYLYFFFFNDTATTEIYTLSLHDALPILKGTDVDPVEGSQRRAEDRPSEKRDQPGRDGGGRRHRVKEGRRGPAVGERSEEHTSELQSRQYLVCRLLLEKKKKKHTTIIISK